MANPYALSGFARLAEAIDANRAEALARNRLGMEQERLGFERALQPLRIQAQGLEIKGKQLEVDAATEAAKQRKYQKALEFLKVHGPDYHKLPPDQQAKHWTDLQNSPLFDDDDRKIFADPVHGPLWKDPAMGFRMLEALARKYRDPDEKRALEADIAHKNRINLGPGHQAFHAEPAPGGGAPTVTTIGSVPDKSNAASQAHQLRQEIAAKTKEFTELRNGYGRVQEGHTLPGKAGDLAMIYGYVKTLDPQTGIKEGEVASAAQAGGLPAYVFNLYNNVVKGQKLPPEARAEILAASRALYERGELQYKKTHENYKGIAGRAGIDVRDVLLDETLEPRPKDANAPPAFNPPPTGIPQMAPVRPQPGAAPPAPMPRPGATPPQQQGAIPEGQPGSRTSPVYPPSIQEAAKLPSGVYFLHPETKELRQRK